MTRRSQRALQNRKGFSITRSCTQGGLHNSERSFGFAVDEFNQQLLFEVMQRRVRRDIGQSTGENSWDSCAESGAGILPTDVCNQLCSRAGNSDNGAKGTALSGRVASLPVCLLCGVLSDVASFAVMALQYQLQWRYTLCRANALSDFAVTATVPGSAARHWPVPSKRAWGG